MEALKNVAVGLSLLGAGLLVASGIVAALVNYPEEVVCTIVAIAALVCAYHIGRVIRSK